MKNPYRQAGMAALAALVVAPSAGAAQAELGYGAAVVSRYVWRGFLYSSTPQIQPSVTVTTGGWEFGTWGSYGVDFDYKEQDQWVAYTAALPSGSLTFTLNDYYFTDDFGDFFEWGGVEDGEATGAHTLELMAAYDGPETFPVHLLLASTVYNDPEASIYGEIGYGVAAGGFDWTGLAGYVFKDGGYYETGEGGLTQLALNASRTLGSLGPLELYATGWVVHNALAADTYFILEIGF